MLTLLDPGPIPLSAIERFDDPDVETALGHERLEPETATFRLVEVSLADLQDVRWFPGPHRWGTFMVDALRAGASLPPIVIVASRGSDGLFGILDGLNRTHAHWLLRRPLIRAYELVGPRRREGPPRYSREPATTWLALSFTSAYPDPRFTLVRLTVRRADTGNDAVRDEHREQLK